MENSRFTAKSMIGLAVTTLFALSSYQNVLVRADDILHPAIREGFEFTGEQLKTLREERLPTIHNFTSYTTEEGKWITIKESNGKPVDLTVWTSGMVAGMFWYQYEATGDESYREMARFTQLGLAGVEHKDDNDLGFQVLNSFGLGYRLTGDEEFKEVVRNGAQSLYNYRWTDLIPAFITWFSPSRLPEFYWAVNIDMIMNMEIMQWVAKNSNQAHSDFEDLANMHAESTWRDLVRDDYSTYHVAGYNNKTGELEDLETYQGYEASSTWSRGQAWAIHGYIMMFRYTPEPVYLEYADLLLGYFDDNLEDDNIPLADFDAPKDELNPRDSSSTAIVASALFECFQHTGNPYYLKKGELYLSSLLLNPEYFNSEATDGWEAILRASSSEHGNPETGSVTGDYYTLESMVRYTTMAASTLLLDEDTMELTNSEAVFTTLHDMDISYLNSGASNGEAPVVIWFGVDLASTECVPVSLVIESVGVDVETANDWEEGSNMLSFTVPAGTFEGLFEVTSVSVNFAGSSSSSCTNTVKIEHLILGHTFATMMPGEE